MALVVGNETYTRFIIEPDDDLDTDVVLAQVDLATAEQLLISGDMTATKAIDAAKKAYESACRERVANGKKVAVTFRPLRARDKAEIEDLVRVGDEDGRAYRSGEMKMLTVRRAVVSWDTTPAWSENVLANLHPRAYEQISEWVSWGIEPIGQNEETGLPLERPGPNREQRRAARKRAAPKTDKALTSAS